MAERTLVVKVIGDDKSLQRAMARDAKAVDTFGKTSKSNLSKFDDAFSKTQKIAAGGFLGGAAATAGIAAFKETTTAASDLNEQITKNQQVFGASASAILDWSKTTAGALGVSREAALEATGTFGNLFTAIGVGGPEAAATSQRLVKLASDMASFNNADPSEVLDALRSGLIGEAEPLRRYGVLLSEARVQQEALRETGKSSAKDLTAQEKALARVAIIFRDTNKAQGDFARTQGGLANQQRILAAQTEDLKASIGTVLLPAMLQLTGAMVDASEDAKALGGVLRDLGAIKIPEIHIPFAFDLPGGTIGGAVGGFIGEGLKTAIKVQFLGVGLTVADLAARAFGDGAEQGFGAQTTAMANQFAEQFNVFTTNALNQATSKAKPPDKSKIKGFGTGLTPKDLFGPLIKDVTDAQQEALLDAKASPGLADDLARLLDIRGSLQEALNDPRLKRKGRIQIKGVLESINGQIDGIQSQIAAGVAERASKRSQAAEDAKTKQRKGFDDLIDAITLKIDKAAATKRVTDDLKRNTELQNAIKAQIKIEGKTTELLGDLRDARVARGQILADAKQAAQFKALGLSETGDKPIPLVSNLTKQVEQLGKNFPDASPKIEAQLDKIAKVLKTKGKELTETSRSTIRDMLNGIRDELQKSDKTQGPFTESSALDVNRILAQFGLDRETERKLRLRARGISGIGRGFAGPTSSGSTFASSAPVIVESHTTIMLDGDVVSRAVTRSQQKTRRRNPAQRRGPNAR